MESSTQWRMMTDLDANLKISLCCESLIYLCKWLKLWNVEVGNPFANLATKRQKYTHAIIRKQIHSLDDCSLSFYVIINSSLIIILLRALINSTNGCTTEMLLSAKSLYIIFLLSHYTSDAFSE